MTYENDSRILQMIINSLDKHSHLHKHFADYKKTPILPGYEYTCHESGFVMKINQTKGDNLIFNGKAYTGWAWNPEKRTIIFSTKTKTETSTNKNTFVKNIDDIVINL